MLKTLVLIISVCVSSFSRLKAEEMTTPSEFLGLPSLAQNSKEADRKRQVESLWASGEKKKAHDAAKKWIKEDDEKPQPYILAASLYCQDSHYKKCLSYAVKSIKKDPQIPDAYYWKGRAYEGLNKPLEAVNEYKAALVLQKEFPPAAEALERVKNKLDPAAGDSH